MIILILASSRCFCQQKMGYNFDGKERGILTQRCFYCSIFDIPIYGMYLTSILLSISHPSRLVCQQAMNVPQKGYAQWSRNVQDP